MTRLPRKGTLRLQPGVTWRREGFGLLLYDRRTDSLYQGNHGGLDVLLLMLQGLSQRELCGRIGEGCRVNEQVVRKDIAEFLDCLEAEGLLETS